ncbi:MAG: FecR domain-containing protein [Flavobacteriales bacterium]|nr:FecR domain-containing protein [Flavobacteriales bacterium]
MEDIEKYELLIQEFLRGESSVEETQELMELIDADEKVKALFDDMKKLYDLTNFESEIRKNLDIDQSFQTFKNNRDRDNELTKPPTPFINSKFANALKIAAMLIIGLGIGYTVFNQEEAAQLVVVETHQTDKIEKSLPDNTVAQLNVNSKITYPEVFEGATREVILEGEAFFNVEQNKNKPFIIRVGNGRIEVKGTAFNVNANNPDSVVVTVKEGLVLFYNVNNPDGVLLEANKKGTMANNLDPVKNHNENYNYLYWLDGTLWFKDARLEDIVTTLNKEWEMNISIANKELNECRVSASYHKGDDVLKLLKFTLDIEIDKTNKGVVISGTGC